jgi:hypothetical protein
VSDGIREAGRSLPGNEPSENTREERIHDQLTRAGSTTGDDIICYTSLGSNGCGLGCGLGLGGRTLSSVGNLSLGLDGRTLLSVGKWATSLRLLCQRLWGASGCSFRARALIGSTRGLSKMACLYRLTRRPQALDRSAGCTQLFVIWDGILAISKAVNNAFTEGHECSYSGPPS